MVDLFIGVVVGRGEIGCFYDATFVMRGFLVGWM